MYKIIQFINKKMKLDIAVVSDKWLSISGAEVYCPPPTVPTLVLAQAHSIPSLPWRKCDITTVIFTSSMYT